VRSPQDFSAVLLIATRDLSAPEEVPDPSAQAVPETQPAAATQGTPATGRRPQPRQGGSKRRVVASLPPASAFDAFPDHSATGPSQSVPPSPAPATAPRPAAAVPAFRPAQPPTAPPVPSFPPASTFTAAPASTAVQPAVQAESMSLLRDAPPATAFQQTQNGAVSASPPPTAPAAVPQDKQWLWQNMQASQRDQAMVTHLQQQPRAEPSLAHVQQQPRPAYPGGPQPTLASQLASTSNPGPEDSDDECIGADPDEVAFARGPDPALGEDSVDWFDVDKLW